MSLSFSVGNAPNPARLIESLRYLGYNNLSAVADICDNCWDAEADTIWITVAGGGKGDFSITIADNGVGMDKQTLDEALRLGSLADRNLVSDLGKFGMGLSTASLSICRRTEVITRSKDRSIFHSVVDVDEVRRRNEFCKSLGVADSGISSLLERIVGTGTGTVVVLSKCDQIQQARAETFANHLRKHLGRIYRLFLSSGKKVIVNSEPVVLFDPLLVGDGGEIQSDDVYPIRYTDDEGKEKSEDIRLRISLLPDFGVDGNRDRGIGMPTQGFYVLRNQREITASDWLGITPRHPDFNRVRAEIYFPASLDAVMGVNFTKHQLAPHQSVVDKLREVALPQIRSLASRIRRQRNTQEDQRVSHDEASRLIGQKANLLPKPKVEIESRAAKTKNGQNPDGKGLHRERVNFKQTKTKELSLPCRFETVTMTSAGPIYNAEIQGKTVVIQWNIDHPFYQRFILDNSENPGMVTATDFLVYSLATAEFVYADDDSRAVMENIRSLLSSTMKTLLS